MGKNVIISIQGKQCFPQCEPEIMEQIVRGTLEDQGEGGLILTYAENETTGLQGTVTTIQVEESPRRVTLRRTGSLTSQMVFEEGRRHHSLYQTDYGAMELDLHTRKMRVSLDGQGGEMTIYYALEIQGGAAGRNMLHISVRPTA